MDFLDLIDFIFNYMIIFSFNFFGGKKHKYIYSNNIYKIDPSIITIIENH
jgi:hypothetical protein